MTKYHIIYISGLGDGFDPIRRFGLMFWRRKNIRVSHVSMHWLHTQETYEQKVKRTLDTIKNHPEHTPVFVGESAGGPVAIAALRRLDGGDARAVTVCGMNQGAANVSATLYERNPAFRDAMHEVDRIVPTLSSKEKAATLTLYSSRDETVRPRDTLLDDVSAFDLQTPQHNFTILTVLLCRYRLIYNFLQKE